MFTKSLRNILISLLALSLLLNVLNQGIIYYTFLIQRDYIVNNLCVEREKAENTCQGCCQLEKKMKEANPEQNSDLPFPESRVKEITKFPIDLTQKSTCNLEEGEAGVIQYIFDYRFLYHPSIFHPPRIPSKHISNS